MSSLEVRIGPPQAVVPGPGVAIGVAPGRANNNLDVVDHDGRRYLAWRAAISHFASRDARINVVASEDAGLSWSAEKMFAFGRDVREPRLWSWNGRLFLFMFTAGINPLAFEPDRIHVSERLDGRWSEPVPISPPDYVVWRVREVGGAPLMTVYRGAGTLYTSEPQPTSVEIWTTANGLEWAPLDGDRPVSHTGGSETEIIEAPGGGWLGVTRKEGPDGGWGSDIIRSPKGAPEDWEVKSVPEKLDSPLMFRHEDEVLLLARRTRGFGGKFDLGLRRLSLLMQTRVYQGLYWLTGKRTALWRIDPGTLDLEWVVDLPSRGDTCFPGMVRDPDGGYTVYNYTSPLDGWDRPWIAGQIGSTEICSVRMHVNC